MSESVDRQRTRVVMVLGSLTMGGAEAQLTSVFEADPATVRRTGVELLTLTSTRSPLIEARLERLGVRVTTIDRARMSFPAFLWSLVRYFRDRRPALVHTLLSGSTGTWGRLSAKLAGVRRLMHSDLSLDPDITRMQRALRPWVDRLTDRFLPNASAIADRLERQGVPRRKIVVLRNGVDLSRFDAAAARSLRTDWGIPENAVVAGFLGMFRAVKRPELFLEAVQALPLEQRPDHLVMAGDGSRMPEVRARIEADPWLRERCRLLGVVGDTPSFLHSIDFLVLTSDTEGLPNAILEAMAMARPSVATRVSDVPFLLGDERFLAPPRDVAAMAAAIARMVALGADGRRALGEGYARRARAEFGMETAAAAFWRAHHELLAGLPGGTPDAGDAGTRPDPGAGDGGSDDRSGGRYDPPSGTRPDGGSDTA